MDDKSITDGYDYIERMKETKNNNNDDKYKEENSQHQNDNDTVINKIKEE